MCDGNYPAGAKDDSSAPWNQHNPEERDFDLLCYQTLSKKMPIFSTNYTEEVDKECDEEGSVYRTVSYNTEDVDWEQEFKDNGYHTPLQLIQLFRQYLMDIQNNTKSANYFPWEIKHLIAECEDWEEAETTYEEG